MPVFFRNIIVGKYDFLQFSFISPAKTILDFSPNLLKAYSIAPIPLNVVARRIVAFGLENCLNDQFNPSRSISVSFIFILFNFFKFIVNIILGAVLGVLYFRYTINKRANIVIFRLYFYSSIR